MIVWLVWLRHVTSHGESHSESPLNKPTLDFSAHTNPISALFTGKVPKPQIRLGIATTVKMPVRDAPLHELYGNIDSSGPFDEYIDYPTLSRNPPGRRGSGQTGATGMIFKTQELTMMCNRATRLSAPSKSLPRRRSRTDLSPNGFVSGPVTPSGTIPIPHEEGRVRESDFYPPATDCSQATGRLTGWN